MIVGLCLFANPPLCFFPLSLTGRMWEGVTEVMAMVLSRVLGTLAMLILLRVPMPPNILMDSMVLMPPTILTLPIPLRDPRIPVELEESDRVEIGNTGEDCQSGDARERCEVDESSVHVDRSERTQRNVEIHRNYHALTKSCSALLRTAQLDSRWSRGNVTVLLAWEKRIVFGVRRIWWQLNSRSGPKPISKGLDARLQFAANYEALVALERAAQVDRRVPFPDYDRSMLVSQARQVLQNWYPPVSNDPGDRGAPKSRSADGRRVG